MREFKTAQLRNDTSTVFNEVMLNKSASIIHRDRPEMVLVLRDHYDHLQERAGEIVRRGGRGSAKIVPELRADKSES